MKKINVFEYAPQIMQALGKGGLFLNSKFGDKINSMTIGWGSLSIYWAMQVFIAPVRLSRFTHHMIEGSGVFTVSVPLDGTLRKELGICGSKSGRDTDKFAECNFTASRRPNGGLPNNWRGAASHRVRSSSGRHDGCIQDE